MPLVSYRCSICKREFKTYDEAQGCEAAHLTVVETRVLGYGIHTYPYEIAVTFNNGETRSYLAQNLS
jgi:hypothetical protein